MTRKSVGGCLDYRALAALSRPEIQHKPDDRDTLAAAARDMAARGLHIRDIAEALNLTGEAVLQLLNMEVER